MSYWSSQRALDQSTVFGFNVTLTPVAVATIVCAEQAFTISGSASNGLPLKSTDHVSVVGPGTGNACALVGARINSTGQLVLIYCNPTAGSLTPAAGVHVVKISRL